MSIVWLEGEPPEDGYGSLVKELATRPGVWAKVSVSSSRDLAEEFCMGLLNVHRGVDALVREASDGFVVYARCV